MIKEWGTRLIVGVGLAGLYPAFTLAHEPYVLTGPDWRLAYAEPWHDFLLPLSDPRNAPLILAAGLGLVGVFILSFIFWRSTSGQALAARLDRLTPLMFLLIRLSLAAALALGAMRGNIFGPELSLAELPYSRLIQGAIYALAFLLTLGWMTELSALVVLAVYLLVLYTFGSYVLVYLPYVWVALAFVGYGAGRFSLDHRSVRPIHPLKPKPFQVTWLRWALAIGLIGGAVGIKILHPAVTLAVVNQYQIFPASPAFFAMGATLSELMFGLFILVGFQSRTVALVAFILLGSAQIFFKEILWPHLPLYALAGYIVAAGNGPFALDQWLAKRLTPGKAE